MEITTTRSVWLPEPERIVVHARSGYSGVRTDVTAVRLTWREGMDVASVEGFKHKADGTVGNTLTRSAVTPFADLPERVRNALTTGDPEKSA